MAAARASLPCNQRSTSSTACVTTTFGTRLPFAMVRRRLGRTDTSHTTLVVATLPAIMGKRERSPAHAADQGVPDARQDSVERVACFRGNAREKAAVRPAVEGYATSPRMARIATRLRSAQT